MELFLNYQDLYISTDKLIKSVMGGLGVAVGSDFSLERYHEYVDEELHQKVIQKTRRIFPADIDLDVEPIIHSFSNYLGCDLSMENPITKETQHMIARLIKPQSHDYNTAHKDIYQPFDNYGTIPKMVNIWIPLAGIDENNSLPLVPGSHLLPESAILRSRAGAAMNGKSYSVASIKSWDGKNDLQRVKIKQGEVLIFSSHLIHGLAKNNSISNTRISYELRLYGK